MCLFEWPATGIVASRAGRHGSTPPNSNSLYDGDGGLCAHVSARMRVHACACESACVHARVRDVFAIYDKSICPG